MRMRIFPYNTASQGATALRSTLNDRGNIVRILRRENSAHTYNPSMCYLNWGSCSYPSWWAQGMSMINDPVFVAIAANKRDWFNATAHQGQYMVEYCMDRRAARCWQLDGFDVIERHVLRGHSGAGIVLRRPDEELEVAPLYTKRFQARSEYRLHMLGGSNPEVFLARRKGLRRGVDNTYASHRIRTHTNGFVFCAVEVHEVPCNALLAAKRVMRESMLDIAAVDVLYNENMDRARVVEINTAPGIEGSTLDVYAEEIEEAISNGRFLRDADWKQRRAYCVRKLWGTDEPASLRVPTERAEFGMLSAEL